RAKPKEKSDPTRISETKLWSGTNCAGHYWVLALFFRWLQASGVGGDPNRLFHTLQTFPKNLRFPLCTVAVPLSRHHNPGKTGAPPSGARRASDVLSRGGKR